MSAGIGTSRNTGASVSSGRSGSTHGTLALTRFALRRDRVLAPLWVAVFVLVAASSAAATVGLYPTQGSRLEAAAAVNDIPALVALYGRIWDPTSIGALSIMKLGAFGAALVGVLAIVLVVRHTRGEEERGRLELLGSTVVGRSAGLAASLVLVGVTVAALGLLTAVSLVASGLPASGSWTFGLSWAAAALVFAGVAAVTAQLTVSARAATGMAVAVVGAAYLLRAVGDVMGSATQTGWVSWLSPIGWAEQMRPYAGDRWWLAVIPLAATAVLVLVAFRLSSRRDLGAGLLPDRVGPARGRIRTSFGLAWRLQRGLLIGWGAAFALLGLIFGGIATNLGPFLDSEQAKEMFRRLGGTQVLTDAFLATELGFVALFAAAYGIAAASRLRGEEESGHTEVLLSTATSRVGWLASHLGMAIAGTTALALVAGVTAGLSYAVSSGNAAAGPPVVGALLAYLPAVWVLTGVVVLLFGVLPRWTVPASWTVYVAIALIGELGVLLDLPSWVLDASPFAHVPRLPAATMTWVPLLWLLLVAAALCAVGTIAFRRRDLQSA